MYDAAPSCVRGTKSWLLIGLSLALASCAPPTRTPGGTGGTGADGGNGGGGGSGGAGGGGGKGGGGGMGGSPTSCTPGNPVCDGKSVRECTPDGKPGAVVDSCTDTCSFGRCTSAECASAESKQSVIGCLFYGLDTDNTEYDDKQIFGFTVGNPGTSPVNVKIQKATGMDMWADELMGPVPPGEIFYFRLAVGPAMGKDYHVEGTGQEFKAYRIASEAPVVAYQINADDENGASGNSGSTLLLPIHALGRHYYAITVPDAGKESSGSLSGNLDHAFVSVVGVKNGTKVDVTPAGNVGMGGKVPAIPAGTMTSFTVNEGEVLNLETDVKGQDLTGSEIVSDKPVVVYAGSVCGGLDPARSSGGGGGFGGSKDCDHIEETMYPVTTWGKDFVVLDMRMPAHQPSKATWMRVVASEDGTRITYDSPRPLPGLPTETLLDKGKFFHLQITDTLTKTNRNHFVMHADKPVQVESFMGVQEGAAIVVPVDQFLDDYLVSAHPWFTGYLMVTRPKGTSVTLDGAPMPDAVFTPGGAGFEVSFVAMKRCEMSLSECGHRIVGTKVGATLTANGGVCNYCYAGGAGARCVNKTAGCR